MNDVYLIDLDGTIFSGTRCMLGSKEWISYLLQSQIPFVFLTNNSKRTPKQLVAFMKTIGFEGLSEKHFFTSAMATASYLQRNFSQRKVWYIGELGLEEALSQYGFTFVSDSPDFVVIGLNENANYALYSKAVNHIRNGAIFVATNTDRLLAKENGFVCGNGAIVHMLEYATCIESIKIGKPNPIMLKEALRYLNQEHSTPHIVGDNLETDIMLGIRAGVSSILVGGGVHTFEDIQRLQIQPTRYISNLLELLP